jgi:superfamily I DNA/RNA helicase
MALGGICPVCHKPLTIGVLHRVLELADRETAQKPATAPDFLSLIPLAELFSEIIGTGVATRKVRDWLGRSLKRFGPELRILQDVPEAELAAFHAPLGEAVARMRRGEVLRQGGYDGEYGVVRVFTEQERRAIQQTGHPVRASLLPGTEEAHGQSSSGSRSAAVAGRNKGRKVGRRAGNKEAEPGGPEEQGTSEEPATLPEAQGQPPVHSNVIHPNEAQLNEAQQKAIDAPGPLLVLAGPGTGKTRTLTARVEALIRKGVDPKRIMAVTFTRRAAAEMRERLQPLLSGLAETVKIDTLHALAFDAWKQDTGRQPILLSEEDAFRLFCEANEKKAAHLRAAWKEIALLRELRKELSQDLAGMLARYTDYKAAWNQADYTDLLEFWLTQLEAAPPASPWAHILHILVDEAQDLSPLQLALIKALSAYSSEGLFCIGDPDQAIYGFRGASANIVQSIKEAWPDLSVVSLTMNYRSGPAILHAAAGLMGSHSLTGVNKAAVDKPAEVRVFEASGSEREAAWVAAQVQRLLGAGSHTLLDAARAAAPDSVLREGSYSPGDIAILTRLKALIPPFQKALFALGIPVAVPEIEAYWADPRVAMVLAAAGRMLGIMPDEGLDHIDCPPKVLALGPLGVSAYLRHQRPFDDLFWQSTAFRSLVRAYDEVGSWSALINRVNFQSEIELVRQKSEKVQIMTMHAAKGLEFKIVFLPCLEEGILPFVGMGMLLGKLDPTEERWDIDAERRLLYVGMTRATEGLFLSRAQRRQLYGTELRAKSSRFLAEMPLEHARRTRQVAHHKMQVRQLDIL